MFIKYALLNKKDLFLIHNGYKNEHFYRI